MRDIRRYLSQGYETPPQPSIAVFSSFRKFLPQVAVARNIFLSNGIYVSNPPSVEPINPGAEYVRFPDDDSNLADYEIQVRVIGRAMLSTAIYVVCPNGYIGKMASYEVGWAIANRAFVYFSEQPEEPMIQPHATDGHTVDAHEMSRIILEGILTATPDPYR